MQETTVKDVMTSLVVMVYPEDSIERAGSRLLRNRVSGAPVVREGKVVGVLSEIDIAQALAGRAGLKTADLLSLTWRHLPEQDDDIRTVADIMSTPVISIGPDDSLFKAAELLDRHGIKRLPVLDADGYLLGIISRGDLVRAMTRSA